MTIPQGRRQYTVEEYFRLEDRSDIRHEYCDGEVFDISGGTFEHSRIIANVVRELGNRLIGMPCGVQESNLRIRVARTTRYVYPDASVLCGEPEFDAADPGRRTLTNPTLVVEVLSPSTESWDRGGKFDQYRLIDSLREYMLVSSHAARVERYLRQPDGRWLFAAAVGLPAVAPLTSIGVDLPLEEVYRGVSVTEETGRSDIPGV